MYGCLSVGCFRKSKLQPRRPPTYLPFKASAPSAMAQVLSFLLQSFLVCLVFSLAQALEEVEVDVTFDARAQPHQRLLLIMLDGFRYDYLENRDYDFPGFQKVIRRGAKPKYMIPDFPTLSYPNYYSFMTGEIPFFFFLFLVRCLVGWFGD